MNFSRWSIRAKLIVGISLLLITVTILSLSGVFGVVAYRGLAKSISLRATELPLAAELAQQVSALRVTYGHAENVVTGDYSGGGVSKPLLRLDFESRLDEVRSTFIRYRRQLESNGAYEHSRYIGNRSRELATVEDFETTLATIRELERNAEWLLPDNTSFNTPFYKLRGELTQLSVLSTELPSHLHRRMENFATEVRGQYRFLMGLLVTSGVLSAVLLFLSFHLFYASVVAPLRLLVHGSRRVAGGDFQHRIDLDSQDEIAELARAMNDMTQRFQEIRDDLDRQVQQRTQEVVRGEQMASVGFLAAGVAHEINNPLASIALCAESLEERLRDVLEADDQLPDEEHSEEFMIVRTYLRMIQDEAFRCKGITERLLDFSRMSDVEKQPTELSELVAGVIEMVGHLGKYKQKHVVFRQREPVVAAVNPQELKQVVLNLITNALDSLEANGTVNIDLRQQRQQAILTVEDNGCGMTEEVLKHLFEPFFTRRRDGQGTGLGMSISYRIVADHGGRIEAHSDGPGRGSRLTVTLPTSNHEQKEKRQAA